MKEVNGAVSLRDDDKRSCSETQWPTRGSAVLVHASERNRAFSPARRHIRRAAATVGPSRVAVAGPPPSSRGRRRA
jgi:hypothetical protein